jgi:hypothetical protein
MPAELLTTPPDDEHLWIPPDALPGIPIFYTPGRNSRDGNGRFTYLRRQRRSIITVEISHTMAGKTTETMQGFANSEMGEKATLAELATFTDGSVLQSLPLDIVGQGSFKGSLVGLTHESAEEAGVPDEMPWNPTHVRTKVALSAWLIRNPLLAAGDLKWGKLQIRYQLCRSPFAPTADEGGLGCHTMWDTHSILTDGKNPWSKVDKTCPGVRRRGTARRTQFPNGQITDIPLVPGNFRDYFEQVGRELGDTGSRRGEIGRDPGEQIDFHQGGGDDDMPTHRWAPKGFQNQFEMPGGMPVSPGDVAPVRGQELDPADPYALLPLLRDFHIPRLKAVIHRNGITPAEIGAGYFERDPSINLSEGERAGYASLGISA